MLAYASHVASFLVAERNQGTKKAAYRSDKPLCIFCFNHNSVSSLRRNSSKTTTSYLLKFCSLLCHKDKELTQYCCYNNLTEVVFLFFKLQTCENHQSIGSLRLNKVFNEHYI